jgi:AhpD family alkylhydroperoxidase
MSARIDYAAVAPELYKSLNGVHAALQRTGFDKKLMDLVFQRASQINGCAFCVDMHGRDLRAMGETPERLDAIGRGMNRPISLIRRKRRSPGWNR